MASLDTNFTTLRTNNLIKAIKLCNFCNNSTNGFDKWLHAKEQDNGPFFPILEDIRGEETVFDHLGRALVCVACFHHLLRQWSSYERRCIPLKKRQYNLIAEEKLSNFQIKREEEIRKEGEIKLKEIKVREERIKKEAKERLELLRQKEKRVREEAERRLVVEEEELEKIKREAARRLKEEKAHEEELKRLLEERILLERQKGDYIRKEAERLLREEKLINFTHTPTNVRTEVLIHSPQGRALDRITSDQDLHENTDEPNKEGNEEDTMEPRRSRTMEYDPVTGCYVRRVPLDFKDKKVEDIVKEEMIKDEKKSTSRSRNSEDKVESGTNDQNGVKSLPHYVSDKDMETEYKFTVKEEVKAESKPAIFDKNGELVDEDVKKAGEDGDRLRFEQDFGEVAMSERSKRSYERRNRSDEDSDSKKAREDTEERRQSLDRRLKGLEERRARLLKGSPENKPDTSEVTITRTVTTETSYSPPASEDSMLGEKMQEAHRKHRNREERIKRRKRAEELISKQTSAGDDKPVTKSAGVKLELRGSTLKKREDSGLMSDPEPNAFSGSNYSYHSLGDDTNDITFTVKKPAETEKGEGDNMNFDKKETTFDRNMEEEKSLPRTTQAKSNAVSLMDEPLVWSRPSSVHPGPYTNDDILFTVKESSNKKRDEKTQKEQEEKRESKRSIIKETEVKVVESKTVQSLFSSEEPQDMHSVKDISSSTKSTTPKELTLERGTFDDKYSFTSTSNSDILRWEMDNVDSGKKSSEAETGDVTDGYRDSLRRTNALGRVGSFKKSRDDLPPAIFHDIESDAPAAPMVDIRTESPSPFSKTDNATDTSQSPNILSKLHDEEVDEERRRRRLEIEEKKKRIAESQRKANVERQRGVPSTEKNNDDVLDPGSTDNVEDLSEKRRSLLMMWESFAEGEGPGPENHGPEMETKSQPFGYDIMMMEAAQSDPNAGVVDYRTMDAANEKVETRTPMVDIDDYHKLDDDELKWERAGQFQPGKLKTKFHEMGRDNSSSETRKTRTEVQSNTTEMPSRVFSGGQRFQNKTPVEEDQSYAKETPEVESAPKLLWDENEGQSTSKSDEDEKDTRKPRVDVDEVHHMTQEEAKWENVGHFQPGKINTSVFESHKKTDQTVSVGSLKVQRREKSRYEQIKKIQRTDSKKELLVPKKVELRADRPEDFEEEDEHERPYVGKIEAPLFHGTVSEEERKRREREARNRREMEEIQREREEERRRQERENLEGMTNVNEFEDDEFDVKVKSKDVRKIDINKFGDFQKRSLIPDGQSAAKQSTKRIAESRHEDKTQSTIKTPYYGKEDEGFDIQVRHRSVGKLSKDSSPFIQQDTSVKESNQSRKVQEMTKSKMDDVVVEESPMEMASPPGNFEDDEFDNMTRARSVKKLDISRMPFSRDDKYDKPQIQDNRNVVDNKALKYDNKYSPQERSLDKTPLVDERKTEREREKREWEEQLKRERDEIEQIKKAHDKAFQDNIKGGNEIDTNDSETEIRNIRKLDLSMFSKFQQGNAAADVIVEAQSTGEVEGAPDYRNEDEEYEIKRRRVGKLNNDWLLQAQEQEAKELELRRKEADKERIRKEKYELELLHMEEKRRRENEKDEVLRSEPYFSEKPQVKKLDSTTMSPFLKGGSPSAEGTGGLSRSKRNKDEVRQERKLARKESRSKIKETEVMHAVETEDVQQSPEFFDEHQKEVGRLNTGKYLQMIDEDLGDKERRKKFLEEERTRRELEEMERQREEEQRRKEIDGDDTSSSSSSTKPQNVNKLDLAQFSPFQKQDTVVMPKNPPTKEITHARKVRPTKIIEKQTMDKIGSEPLLPDKSEKEWLEKERNETLMYEEKRQNVGRLDVNRLIQARSEEDRERQSRIKELERQRIITEREEVERQKAEKKRKMSAERDSDIFTTSHDDHKVLSVKSSDSQRDREREEEWTVEEKRKGGIGRLNVDQFVQSLSQEEEEKNRRKLELEKERIRQEAEEKERLQMEQQLSSENITISNVQEVHSAPEEDFFYERGIQEEREREEELSVEEKRKSIGRLDVNKFVQSISEEAEEKRRRKIELEKERIRRENEERELLRLEQEGKTKEESNVTITEKSSKNYVILHKDSKQSGDQRGEEKERECSEKEKYPNFERERDEELSVEAKRKNVGKLDFNRFVQSLGQEEEEKQRRMIEFERERRRREKEEEELLRLEQERVDDTGRSTATLFSYVQVSRSDVNDVQSSPYDQLDKGITHSSRIDKEREEELSVEEKRKSVGRLNVKQFFQSLNEEEEEKRKRRIKMENERIERENQERELLRIEQERSRTNQDQVNTSVVQEVHSAPSADLVFIDEDKIASLEREREEAMSVEDKRKSVGKLDFNQFIESLSKEDKEKQMRKIELERERVRREQEERETEEEQLRLRERSSYSEEIRSSSVEVVHSEVPIEYEDRGSPQNKKEVGRLDFQKFSQQFNQEARERERRAKDLEIERLLFEREEMKGFDGRRSVPDDSLSYERREVIEIEEKRKYSNDDNKRLEDKVESVKSDESSDGDKPVPKRLDLSKFSAFQSGTGTRVTKDDSNVKRRGKAEVSRQARPKSIAGTSFGGVTNGEARSGAREFRIIH